MRWPVAFLPLVTLVAASGCTLDFDLFEPRPGAADGATDEAGAPADDGLAADAAREDSRVEDTQIEDSRDSGSFDASEPDTSTPDASVPDTDAPDTQIPDTQPPDAPDVLTTCEGTTFDGHCYFALQSAANWTKARNECATRNAHLVTIGSDAEQVFVDGLAATAPRWIGLRRMGGVFQWITNEPVTFTRWGTGEPKGSGDCARLRAANDWSEEDCKGEVGTICERD